MGAIDTRNVLFNFAVNKNLHTVAFCWILLIYCDFYYACCLCGSSEEKGGGRNTRRIPVIFIGISEGVFSVPRETRKRNCQKSLRLHNLSTLKRSTLDLLKVTFLPHSLSYPQHKMHASHNIKIDVCKKLEFHIRWWNFLTNWENIGLTSRDLQQYPHRLCNQNQLIKLVHHIMY